MSFATRHFVKYQTFDKIGLYDILPPEIIEMIGKNSDH